MRLMRTTISNSTYIQQQREEALGLMQAYKDGEFGEPTKENRKRYWKRLREYQRIMPEGWEHPQDRLERLEREIVDSFLSEIEWHIGLRDDSGLIMPGDEGFSRFGQFTVPRWDGYDLEGALYDALYDDYVLPHRINSPYDCTGQSFVRGINLYKDELYDQDRYMVEQCWGIDV